MEHDDDAVRQGWFSDNVATFGDRLAAAREAKGLSQVELAARLGVQCATLRKWEDDQSEPRANRVQMLAGLLGVSLAWLMTGVGQGIDQPQDHAADAPERAEILNEMNLLQAALQQTQGRLGALQERVRVAFGLTP